MHTMREAPLPFDALEVPLLDGVTLVEASAGTGKTFAITRLVLRLLLEQRVTSLSEVLVVTFTDKATQELITRIRGVLRTADAVWSDSPPARTASNDDLFVLRGRHGDSGRAIIDAALGSLDDLGVSTIHGFCQRMLAESALETRMPFRTTFVEDETEPLLRAALDWMRRRLLQDPVAAGQLVSAKVAISLMVDRFVRPFRRQAGTLLAFDPLRPAQATVADFVHTIDNAFDREKSRRHLLGFDDLLRTLCNVLTEEGPQGPLAQRIRSRYRAALIDEFQDTDNTQFPIFRNAFDGCPLFLIGDPKQSIYAFRGADIHAYLAAADVAERRYTLTRNFRSTPAYVQAVEALFTRAPQPFRYDESRIDFPRVTAATSPASPGGTGRDGCGALVWWWVDRSLGLNGQYVAKDLAVRLLVTAIANEIVRLTADGLPCGSIAVLLRTNEQVQKVKAALDAAGVPSVVGSSADVLDSEDAAELGRVAAAIASPYDHRDVSSALATRIWGCDAATIAAVRADAGEMEFSRITDRFAELREMWRLRGVSAALGAVLAERGTAERLLSLPDGERRLTNVRHVIELLHTASSDEGVTLEALQAWMARERTVSNTPDRRQQRLETDSAAVQILTIHKAKGLEFDVVFCPSLWDERTPKAGPFNITAASVTDADGRSVLDLGSDQHVARLDEFGREEAAEAQRLAYVALTRAVHRCYVAIGDIGKGNVAISSPLGWLLRPSGGAATMRDVLATMVAQSGGGMSLHDVVPAVPLRAASGGAADDVVLAATPLMLPRGQLDTWRLSSFTGLVSGAGEHGVREMSDATIRADVPSVPHGFRAFPAGAQAGIALHDVFEHLDFAAATSAEARVMVAQRLQSHGLTGAPEVEAGRLSDVVQLLDTVVTMPFAGADFALRDVQRLDMLREWRFDLSVATMSVDRIANALAAHGSAHAQAYAPVLRTLRDSAMPGYVGGVIDLAFEHHGRWWIVDWKSNQLGAADSQYMPAALGDVMMQAHYTLQYHLYLVAMHRFLRTRVIGYDPAVHWGGVAYAFLRGIGTDSASRGWFIDTPTPALLDALDAALGRRT